MSENRQMGIRKLAELAGCAPSTVSRVLAANPGGPKISDETRRRVLEACRRYNYRPNIHASRFFSKRSRSVGLVIPESAILCDRNLSRFQEGGYRVLDAGGYRLSIVSRNSEFLARKRYIDVFETCELDGLIIWGAEASDTYLDELAERRLPFILAGNRFGDYPCISCDNVSGIRQSTLHCIGRGAKRLAYVSIVDYDAGMLREQGFLEAAAGYEMLILREDNHGQKLSGEQLEKLRAFRPDAVVCLNDPAALDIINLLRDNFGLRVPEDVLVTGGDDAEYAGLVTPGITTFDQRAIDCGRRAAEQLVDHLENGTPLRSELLPVKLICRASA